MSWRQKPSNIDEMDFNSGITHVAFFDENGDANFAHIIEAIRNNRILENANKYFALTSVLFATDDLDNVKDAFVELKEKYWGFDGCYSYPKNYMKVCFHSREIRRSEGPFSKNVIDYEAFINDLNILMSNLPAKIASSFINKETHYRRYSTNAVSPYELSLTFILERLVKHMTKQSDQLIIILEARGKKEDKLIHDKIVNILDFGTKYVSKEAFRKIKGVYFNKKRPINDPLKSYFGLEIADLCSYPIYKYCLTNSKDKAFACIESKIHRYPNYFGRGLKLFP